MNTIQIVKNSDRCHVSVNGTPETTFIYLSYPEKTDEQKALHALHDAKVACFDILSNFNRDGIKAAINTNVVVK